MSKRTRLSVDDVIAVEITDVRVDDDGIHASIKVAIAPRLPTFPIVVSRTEPDPDPEDPPS